jgi:hypothetical protein
MAGIRAAAALALSTQVVEDCIKSGKNHAEESEALFRRAFRTSLTDIPKTQRTGGLNSVAGHIAESVAEVLLSDLGWIPVSQMTGPFSAGHGIDLAFLTSDLDRVVVVEVKGTLQPNCWPRLTRGDIDQFSPDWLDKIDNPGMSDLGLTAEDVTGLVLMVHFARRQWKCAFTRDFTSSIPIHDLEELVHA